MYKDFKAEAQVAGEGGEEGREDGVRPFTTTIRSGETLPHPSVFVPHHPSLPLPPYPADRLGPQPIASRAWTPNCQAVGHGKGGRGANSVHKDSCHHLK
jgi:hypothetical protein